MEAGYDNERARWEELGGIDLDAGTCAFGDALQVSSTFSLRDRPGGVGAPDGRVAGIPLVICGTRADLPLPVEVRRDATGRVSAARMEFVDDVGELKGIWQPIGVLHIKSGRCVACDPFCNSSGGVYRFEFDLPPASWLAERFEFDDDVLGLRITRQTG